VSAGSVLAGGILVIAGTGVVVYGSFRYRATARELEDGRFETGRSTVGPVTAAAVLTVSILLTLLISLLVDV